MSKSIPGLLLFLFLAFSSRAEQPIFNISSAEANPGEIIEIDFHVDNFTNLILAQFSINWDPAVLEFVQVRNINADVNGLSESGSFNLVDFIDEGKIPFVWFEPTTNPESIPDGALFFTLAFEVIGAPCQSTLVAITGDPTEIEVAEDNKVEVGLISNDGTVSVPGVGCSQNITFTGNSVVGSCGSEACIQFTVNNFSEVASMDFALVYNPAILQFDRFQNYAGLSGFGGGNTNSPTPGILRVVWSSLNAENESLPDGTTLFEICFDVIGSGGQTSSITFGNTPPVEIADVNSNIHTVNIIPASITSECAITGHALIAENVCTEPNGITCIDISVNDFEDIIVMQFSINWDPNLFHFHHIEGLNLPELTPDLFGLPPDIAEGQLSVGWFTVESGVTVPDLTTIFTLCLEAVGPAGASSPITFSDIPTEVEFATEDSLLTFGLIHGSADIRLDCEDTICELSYVLTPVSPNCPGESTGSLNLNLDIGSCPCTPTFVWSTNPPVTTEDLIGVPAGTYTVTITCDNIVVASGTISDPAGIGVTSNITHPVPPNPNSGAINITVTGGTPPYNFQWSTTPPVNTEDLLNIPAGTYTVTITDANGCTFVPDPFVVGGDLTAFVTNASCEGSCNGSIALSPSFGTSPYTYVWNTVPIQTMPTLSNLCAGTYCVTITESGGVTRDSCFVVTQPNLNVSASITHDVNENCTGAIDLSITGAVLPVTYMWSNGQTSQDIINLCVEQYCVTITYGAGCTFDTCFNVSGNLALNLDVENASCHNVCDGEIRSEVIGGSGTITYLWSNNATTPDLTNLCPGIYSLTITDASGNTASASHTITAPPALIFTSLTTDPSGPSASDGFISVIASGGVPPYSYQWVGPVPGNGSAMNNLPAGTYQITVIDQNGCEFTDNIELRIDGVPCYEANKIITPNSDGKNDFFIIQCILNDDNHLYIFNRFGGLVYETTNYTNNWTGVDEDNQPVADGGYMWVLEIQNPAGPRILKGTINVLRTAD